ELAGVLVRSAAVLDVPARLHQRTGCLLVSVAGGPDRERIVRSAELAPARDPAPPAARAAAC
ncbi:hypothetical protein JM949_31085, partial [Micromonospora sp. STR1s_6]|nr:hypothetical protein [Micromonospora tarensis]